MDTPPFPAWVDDLDARTDEWFDRLRRPALDPVFYGISSAADHSILWLSISALRAAVERDPSVALRISAVIAAESALTNGPIKMLFRRVRPERDTTEPPPYGMRIPITSSFPSGHATAAFTAAMVLTRRPREAWFWFPIATLVASSRIYVKMHHASDVIAGAALGIGMGALGRRFVRRRRR